MFPDLNDPDIDRLFHDAEHKLAGADFARRLKHISPAEKMESEAEILLKQAGVTMARWDGDRFSILFGENLQEGRAFFGETATDALNDFYKAVGVLEPE
jgi:hypothetical protein